MQSIPYSRDEKRLAQYHGAIFAETLQTMGVDACKMVLGDPAQDQPESPLLDVSSVRHRISPDFWAHHGFDLVVVYGGENTRNLPMLKAIKNGSPETILVLKMDSANGPFRRIPTDLARAVKIAYLKDRHGHVRNHVHDSNAPHAAAIKAFFKLIRLLSPAYSNQVRRLFEVPDFISYESRLALDEARLWLKSNRLESLGTKLIWLGYPVRDEFAKINDHTCRKPKSIISVANWTHAKDLVLHAKSLAIVLRTNPAAIFTLVGANSNKLYDLIINEFPAAAPRIRRIEEVLNTELPELLQTSNVFMLCSFTEGYCSVVAEALCSGCSVALSTGPAVPCFKEFSANHCGTQARSRRPEDMAEAVLNEIAAWENGLRDPVAIQARWSKTLVSNLCSRLAKTCGFELPTISRET